MQKSLLPQKEKNSVVFIRYTMLTRARPTRHSNFREGINHASRELLVYDSRGQTTPA